MIALVKKQSAFLFGIFAMSAIVFLILNALHYVGVASAQVADPANPTQSDVINMLTSGQYLPAVGAILVLIIGIIRKSATHFIPWFATKAGGYVLAYSTTMLIYVGTSFEQGQMPSLKLIWMAIVAAIGSAGLLEHSRDFKVAIKKVPPAAAGAAVMLLIGTTLLTGANCGANPPKPIADVIDCTKQDQAQILAAEADCSAKLPDWKAVEACAIGHIPSLGWQIGGCVVSDLVQQYLTKKAAAQDVGQSNAARGALEDYRTQYGHGSTFHTSAGDL